MYDNYNPFFNCLQLLVTLPQAVRVRIGNTGTRKEFQSDLYNQKKNKNCHMIVRAHKVVKLPDVGKKQKKFKVSSGP